MTDSSSSPPEVVGLLVDYGGVMTTRSCPRSSSAVYSASKAAVLSITRSFAYAFAPHVRVVRRSATTAAS